MAKTQATSRTVAAQTAAEIPDLPKKVQAAVEAIRKPFISFAQGFKALAVKREQLAPQFMKAFGLWQAETGGTFVGFVRYLDPSVGEKREEYRSHTAYQAADYLRRLQGNARQQQALGEVDEATRAVPPGDALARFVATFLAMIPEARIPVLREAMKVELNWDEKRIDTLFKTAGNVEGIVDVHGKTLDNLRLTLPEHEEVAA